ncbi:serine/threonine-protein kinase polo-like, partial [Temnothorax curvispinosus]|uniref:Serine/threonine-protein kinase polo-like n=1 Tax=Temnothorax curvispinosus TaxID=300111 RepID=A0A6J1QLW6_9HYME
SLMAKSNQREKMTQEIAIYQTLNHKHIVDFHDFFDDTNNIYIILLELCRMRSMMELHKCRKALLECEMRYFMKQILDGIFYLHQHRRIHRDLMLGNLFLNDDLQVKIGDFRLATRLEDDGERKKIVCGTLNYIKLEVLTKIEHSYEADVWSVGVIMYTLFVDKPPFETSSLREMYSRIKQVEYKTPQHISKLAMNMVVNMLQLNPSKCLFFVKLMKDIFFSSGYMPASLPLSCLTMESRLDTLELHCNRKPFSEMNLDDYSEQEIFLRVANSLSRKAKFNNKVIEPQRSVNFDIRKMLQMLKKQIVVVLKTKPARETASSSDELTDPAAQPVIWINKWMDCSDKYGFGYQLSDDSVGVMYNDGTRLIMMSNSYNIYYINREGDELYYTVKDYPAHLEKKMKVINFFLKYMNKHLLKAGGSILMKRGNKLFKTSYIHQWFRTQTAVVMQLSNGTVQINFLDHAKIIMCPLMAAVTYIDHDKNFKTYRFQTIQENGCCKPLADNLMYAYEKIKFMLTNSQAR